MKTKLLDVLDSYTNTASRTLLEYCFSKTLMLLYNQRINHTRAEHLHWYLCISQKLISKEIARSTEKEQACVKLQS